MGKVKQFQTFFIDCKLSQIPRVGGWYTLHFSRDRFIVCSIVVHQMPALLERQGDGEGEVAEEAKLHITTGAE